MQSSGFILTYRKQNFLFALLGDYILMSLCYPYLTFCVLPMVAGCVGYRLPSQYAPVPPEGESKRSNCWMVIYDFNPLI